MTTDIAHLQMFDYVLKKYGNKELFAKTRMVVEIDGKLWTGDFLILEDCHIIEIDWADNGYTQVELTRESINADFDEAIQISNVNVSQNRIDAKIASLKHPETLYQEIKRFIGTIDNTNTSLKPLLYNAYCLDTRVKLPFLDISNKDVHLASLTV
ncbi:hypothetical protein PWEIH_12895 [Listeria weihenstephanensis FSL R9-0317]|uniref:Uncharacterized protein n=1 Tax=Listeria weihenstephanensis TaxID=1006155 RepID=A0A1S7FUC0_9LIST|nr:hypothetical protein [Listeria weihenstephanensis]AQY50969.1 hypothetical protein UE46_07885 [Listeria weihenstephanensis]EUJ36379.1 hypothetical protein PWEIH_12895 [Listeria weihenstephanensis FSL R9-0317]MBC1499911.1 hypothetical protein [Listeria weihenstephanensis]